MDNTFLFVAAGAAGLALVFAVAMYFKIMQASPGDQKMQDISKLVQDGAAAFVSAGRNDHQVTHYQRRVGTPVLDITEFLRRCDIVFRQEIFLPDDLACGPVQADKTAAGAQGVDPAI